jgi:hypothetical protein
MRNCPYFRGSWRLVFYGDRGSSNSVKHPRPDVNPRRVMDEDHRLTVEKQPLAAQRATISHRDEM